MLLCFLNGGKYLSVSKVSWEGAVRREGSTADMRSQREEEEMGLDPEHSEKTRGYGVLSGRRMGGIIGRRNTTRGGREEVPTVGH